MPFPPVLSEKMFYLDPFGCDGHKLDFCEPARIWAPPPHPSLPPYPSPNPTPCHSPPHYPTQSGAPNAAHRGSLHTRQIALEAHDPAPALPSFYKEIREPVPTKWSAQRKSRLLSVEPQPHPGLLQTGSFPTILQVTFNPAPLRQPRVPALQLAHCGRSPPPPALRLVSVRGPAPFSWKVPGNLSKVFSFRGPRPQTPESTPQPAPLRCLAVQPAVLGRRRFREGLGHRGQKIRRLAPPRPPGPPPALSWPAGAAASQFLPAVRAPWLLPCERCLRPLALSSRRRPAEPQLPSCRCCCRDMVLCVQG